MSLVGCEMCIRDSALTELVDNLSAVIATASTSMTDHQEEFGLMVTNLVSITDTLKRNADNIELLMDRLPPALRSAADATGNGAWTDVNAPAAVIPDNLLCAIGVMQGCR
ncbi:hypothetical protein [Rhodococcus sp. NPDC058514]|uniref:hypothetical protein n=1 Tax=Rhodococcus sp. NPDC058514 TaxID=3346532 RepID=UPI003655B0E3